MPANDGLVVFPRAACNAFVVGVRLALAFDSIELLLCVVLGLDADVDVPDLKVDVGDELNTSNL